MDADPQFRLGVESHANLLLDFMPGYSALDGHVHDHRKAGSTLRAPSRDSNRSGAWLILDGNLPAGSIVLCFGYSLEWLGRDAFGDEFCGREQYRLAPKAHGAQFLEDAAWERGVRALPLEVVNGNPMNVYQKSGFRKHFGPLLPSLEQLCSPVLFC